MNDTEDRKPRRRMAMAGMLAAGLLAGGILAGANLANAAGSGSSSSTSGASGSSSSSNSGRPAMDPAAVEHGPGETLLTGSDAATAKAAALKAVPGATVIRVETDSGAGVYEAHLQKADGTYLTVTFDKNFNVTGTEDGFGGPGGHGGPGAPPSSNGTTTG